MDNMKLKSADARDNLDLAQRRLSNWPLEYLQFEEKPNQEGPVYNDIWELADHVYHNWPGVPSYWPWLINHRSSFVPASWDNI